MSAAPDKNSDIYEASYIKDLFDSMSVSYDRMNYITSFGFSYRWRLQFLKKINRREQGLQVLDLMTGMGETWRPARDYFPGCHITALDFCDGMIAHAHKRNSQTFDGEIKVVKQDALNNSLEDDSFDVIVCGFGLKTFNEEQLARLAGEVKRVLKPNGQFSFIEVSVPKNRILRFFYGAYLKHIIPVLGWMLLGNPWEYRMLWKYTSIYTNSERAAAIFSEAGLQAQAEKYFFGCASGISGSKTT